MLYVIGVAISHGETMDHMKDLEQFREELLALIKGQIAIRQYSLDELRAPMSTQALKCELKQLDELKTQVLKLGVSK